jgi:CBS domain-containing protein
MSRSVVVIPQDMSLRTAAHLLWQVRISGAPVVDAEGRCVGVLSSTDFVHVVEQGAKAVRSCYSVPGVCSDWQVLITEPLPEERVCAYMTPNPVTAAASASMGELAQRMLEAHIHRVIVVDEQCRPIGVVSSTDILSAVASSHGKAASVLAGNSQ